jgi:hypothetical protein
MAIFRKGIDTPQSGTKAEILALLVCVGRGVWYKLSMVPGFVNVNVDLY